MYSLATPGLGSTGEPVHPLIRDFSSSTPKTRLSSEASTAFETLEITRTWSFIALARPVTKLVRQGVQFENLNG